MTLDNDFETLFRSEYPRLVSLGVAMTGRRDVATDLAQETMMRAHRRWTDVVGYEVPAAWCRKVMTNLLIDHHRRVTAERAAIERLGGEPGPVVATPALDRWSDLVAALPHRQRIIVTLFYADDRSVEDIADVLGVSTGAIKASLFKARRTLRRHLEGQSDG